MGKRTFLMYAGSETDSNILYASGFLAPDPFIFIEREGKKFLVMSDLEIDRAKATSKADEVLSLSKISESLTGPGKPLAPTPDLIGGSLEKLGIKEMEVPSSFPVGLADALRGRGFRLNVAADPFFRERLNKLPGEIEAVADAQRKVEKAMKAAALALRNSTIRKGRLFLKGKPVTSETLRKTINLSLMEENLVGMHTIVACGDQAVDPHSEGEGPLLADQAIIIDIFPRSMDTMYFGDMTRTFVVGKPSEALKRQYNAVLEAQLIGLKRLRAGAKLSDVHDAVKAVFSKYGYETGIKDGRQQGFFHSTGHGLGLDIHEPPRIFNLPGEFEEGMIVSVEPGLYYLGVGGVRIEDLVVVQKNGVRNLNKFHKRWKP
jgi:Xaa-Pro aminopeptidase